MDPETAAMFKALMGGGDQAGGPPWSPTTTPTQFPIPLNGPPGLGAGGGPPQMQPPMPPMGGPPPGPPPQPNYTDQAFMSPPPNYTDQALGGNDMWHSPGGSPGVNAQGEVDPRIMDPMQVIGLGWAGGGRTS